jgi:dienelactone hydrolase
MTLRDRLGALLGGYSGDGFASVTQVRARGFDGWVLEDLCFHRAGEDIPALFLRPPEGHPPVPAVIYAHAHGNNYATGREELVEGRPALIGPYAPDLKALGCAALCLDMPSFGNRQASDEQARAKAHLWRGGTLFGQMLAELGAGVGFLADHHLVDATRIGALGFSMGSTHAFWLAALDVRIRAAAALCSFADLGMLVESGAHEGHGLYMTVPGLVGQASTGEIAGLTAPRALMIAAGFRDWSTPEPAFRKAEGELRAAYAAEGAVEKLRFHIEPDIGHQETAAMRRAVLDFLRQELVG